MWHRFEIETLADSSTRTLPLPVGLGGFVLVRELVRNLDVGCPAATVAMPRGLKYGTGGEEQSSNAVRTESVFASVLQDASSISQRELKILAPVHWNRHRRFLSASLTANVHPTAASDGGAIFSIVQHCSHSPQVAKHRRYTPHSG